MIPYRLRRTTEPAIEPITAAYVKLHAHISHDVEDSLIDSWIKSFRIQAEDLQHRSFIGQIWEVSLDRFPFGDFIYLPRSPVMQLMSILYYGTDNTEYTLYYDGTNPISTTEEGGTEPTTNSDIIVDILSDPGRVCLAYNKIWPTTTLRPYNSVIFKYATGYGLTTDDVPETIRDAGALYCTWRNENRAAETGLPEAVKNMLRPNKLEL